jgi:FAD/FMN-containing dehydrogenase
MQATIISGTPARFSARHSIPALRVRSAIELRSAVQQARRGRCSVDVSELDRVLRLDSARGLVELQACASWKALASRLREAGCEAGAFAAADTLGPTVGESAMVNAPGPDGRPVATHVAAIAFVTPDGELRRVAHDCNPELLRLVLGGHGAFGMLYSLTLRLDSLARSARNVEATIEEDWHSPCLADDATWYAEALVPPQRLEQFLEAVRDQAAERRVELAGMRVRRTLAEDETFLRWAVREYSWVTLRLRLRRTLGGNVLASEARRWIIAEALRQGGSFPIACGFDASVEQVHACYPQLAEFLAAKRRYDPAELLQSDWYRHFKWLLGPRCRVRWDA